MRLSPTLSKAIFLETAGLFGLCLATLTSLILLGRVLQLRELFLSLNLSFLDIFRLFAYLSPFFLLLIIPISCMLAVFLTFLRMSTDRELVALRAGGVSITPLIPAPMAVCVLASLVCLLISFYGVSWGMDNFRATVLDYARTKTQLTLQPGTFNQEFPGLTLYARKADNVSGVLTDVMVEDATRQDLTALILAERGRVATDNETGRILFALEDGSVYRQQGGDVSVLDFATYFVRLDISRLLKGFTLEAKKPKEMSITDLYLQAADPTTFSKDEGNYHRKILVEIQKRYALPMACLILGLFALPLAFLFEGLKQQLGILVALAFFFLYYTGVSLAFSMGEAGVLDPRVGVWLPNALFLLFSLYGIRVARKERAPQLVRALGGGLAALRGRAGALFRSGRGAARE